MDARGRGGKVALLVTVRPTPAERLHHSLLFAQKALKIKLTVRTGRCPWLPHGLSLPMPLRVIARRVAAPPPPAMGPLLSATGMPVMSDCSTASLC